LDLKLILVAFHPEPSFCKPLQNQDLGFDSPFGAVSALHGAVPKFRETARIDASLRIVVAAWERLSEQAHREILAIIVTATTETKSVS